MKKLAYLVSLSFVLVFALSTNFASAEESKNLDLEEKLQNLSHEDLSDEKKEEEFVKILEAAPAKEQQAYLEEVGEIVQEGLSTVNVESDEDFEIDLGSGISVEFESEDTSDSAISTRGYEYSNGNMLTKAYGDRKFTCTVTIKSLGITIGSLALGNHYTVGSYGLKMRYATDNGTEGIEPSVVIGKTSASVIDGAATEVGHNMNARGNYAWKIGVKGIYKSFNSEIYSTIELTKLNKTDKEASVYQNYKFTE